MTYQEQKDALYENLLAGATNSRLRDSLEKVKEACDFLEQSHAAITVTSVGRYCNSKWDGPKSQSIRNATHTLLRYVQTRKAQQPLPKAQRNTNNEPLIQDETVRAYVTILKAERDEAIRMKNRIIGGLRKVPGIPVDELIATGFSGPAKYDHKETLGPSPMMISALAKLLDAERLQRMGMELYRDRVRHGITGEVFLERREVEAIRAVIGVPSTPDVTDKVAHVDHQPVQMLK